jgi:uncharacterized damage-inducible protein DinB
VEVIVFSREVLRELFRHMEWADANVWAAIPRNAPADDRLRNWIVHIHVVQRAFLSVWTKQDFLVAFKNPEEFVSMSDVCRWAQPYYREAERFIDEVTDERLAQPLELPWAAQIAEHLGRPQEMTTLGDTCFQVTSHSTYHRGQVNARLREIGAQPPLVDYIAWAWFGKPGAQWT